MAEANVDTFFQLLHAMIRVDFAPNEPERSRDVMTWTADKGARLGRVLYDEERRLIAVAMKYWHDLRKAPSRELLGQWVNKETRAEGMNTLLQAYDTWAPTYAPYTANDMDALLATRADEWRRLAFVTALEKASNIANMGMTGTKKGEKDLIGTDDARVYLLKELQSSLIAPQAPLAGGSIKDTASRIESIYAANESDAQNGSLAIRTGIRQLDDVIFGLKRGTFNLILGHAGQRKSAMARTVAYNAAINGFRVLFIPLEISFNEELATFAMMHACNKAYFVGTDHLSIDRFHRGLFDREEKQFLVTGVIPAMKLHLGDRLVIRQLADTAWENIRSVIELENFIAPVDLVVLDYIGLIDTRQHRDKTLAINEAAIQIKQMCSTFDNGRGVTFLTPVQGSRKGYDEAKQNEGVWDKSGIYMYSELEKSADLIFYTYMTQEMQTESVMKLGTCKSRRSADAPACLVRVDPSTGYVGGSPDECENGMPSDPIQSDRKYKDPGLARTYDAWK